MSDQLQCLRSILNQLTLGLIPDSGQIEPHLAACWPEFAGNDQNGMVGYKLLGRMESVNWQPPILSFTIERHGGTVLGSTRAEVQRWQVDLQRMTAECTTVGQRQLHPSAKSVRKDDLQAIAQEIAALIENGTTDDRIDWKDSSTVHVVVGRIIPSTSGFKRTVTGRRRRFRKALQQVLSESAWAHIGKNVFSRTMVSSDE